MSFRVFDELGTSLFFTIAEAYLPRVLNAGDWEIMRGSIAEAMEIPTTLKVLQLYRSVFKNELQGINNLKIPVI